MAREDSIKWDEKYRADASLLTRERPARFVEAYWHFAGGGKALDLACGGGRNALFLARKGFEVDALDISEVAIASLAERSRGLPLKARVADLDDFIPPRGRYGLIVMTNFLDRKLLRHVVEALAPGGILIVETYMHHPENEKRGNPDFLLAPGELRELLDDDDLQTIAYEEFFNDGEGERFKMCKQAIVVRKRTGLNEE
ncbi:class I SAM-dependent methyltransferase [Hydrogenimonas sp.]